MWTTFHVILIGSLLTINIQLLLTRNDRGTNSIFVQDKHMASHESQVKKHLYIYHSDVHLRQMFSS